MGDDHIHLIGEQLNGLSQAVSYGDDASMATNYPLVRSKISPVVSLLSRHLSITVLWVSQQTNRNSRRNFDIPPGIEDGKAELCVIANGIFSESIPIITRSLNNSMCSTSSPYRRCNKGIHFITGKDIHMGGLVDGQLWVLTRHGFVPIGPWNPNDLVIYTIFYTLFNYSNPFFKCPTARTFAGKEEATRSKRTH